MEDVKSAADNNASKNAALDHLGIIASHIRSATLKTPARDSSPPLKSLDEVNGFEYFLLMHADIGSRSFLKSTRTG